MKHRLLPLLLLSGVAFLPAQFAHAQEKPVLNTAPPGPPPAQPRSPEPAPAPAPAQEATPPRPEGVPNAQPTPDNPSGLNFPGRSGQQPASQTERVQTKKFLYSNVGLGLSSSAGITNFNASIAPAVGFRITDKFSVGPGISYSYNSYSLSPEEFLYTYGQTYPTPNGSLTEFGSNSLSSSSIGLKVFAQYTVYKEFFVHGEYEVTNAELAGYDSQDYLVKIKRQVTSPLAGVGYRSYLGEKAAVDIVGLYNFNSSIFSLYPPLVLRFSLLYNIGK